jgi:hypothetical protein
VRPSGGPRVVGDPFVEAIQARLVRSGAEVAARVERLGGDVLTARFQAGAERARLIEERATTLARTAIQNRAGRVLRMGLALTQYAQGPALRELAAVAAYRDKYGITGEEALGPTPADPRQARDRDAMHAALRRTPQAPHRQALRLEPSTPSACDQGLGGLAMPGSGYDIVPEERHVPTPADARSA